jgi:hypothetical protein
VRVPQVSKRRERLGVSQQICTAKLQGMFHVKHRLQPEWSGFTPPLKCVTARYQRLPLPPMGLAVTCSNSHGAIDYEGICDERSRPRRLR